jgi:RHS repeat-associated protein
VVTIVWASDYEAFGKAWEYVPGSTSPPTIEVNLRFPGQYLDRETGLHYNWHRYYDPNTGRYLTPDPLLTGQPDLAANLLPVVARNPGMLQPLAYTENNPLINTDSTGLASKLGIALGAACAVIDIAWIVSSTHEQSRVAGRIAEIQERLKRIEELRKDCDLEQLAEATRLEKRLIEELENEAKNLGGAGTTAGQIALAILCVAVAALL